VPPTPTCAATVFVLGLALSLGSPAAASCVWDEGFDSYPAGSSLHGQGDWKGIDNDPFFEAFVSTPPDPSNSPPLSAVIETSSDLVREATCAGEGLVVLSVQQYIASPYTAGTPSEPDAGSFFNVFNTYSDGGTQELSTSIRFDPGSGNAHVLHGDASNSIVVPYDTDRWVKIQQVIDLENDWTRIYYDDDLVTEYPWTGGVFGGGAGALDVRGVELYANGSSPLYYDDLKLQPIAPFEESFDPYLNGSDLHGQGGWKGFDGNPAAGAPVSQDQARSSPQSVKVEGTSNPLHEIDTPLDGVWSFEAWQYIPSGFAMGPGIESEPGSIFRLYNTYSDAGSQEKSVEIRADSSAAKLEIFTGSGSTTSDVPYHEDRWVKIQIIIDLDEDWTRIYYDDDLVTEYPWTGGILGGASGALDIGAVTLYGNGASPAYYDDLSLVRGCGEGRNSDADGDGRPLGQELFEGTNSCVFDAASVPTLPLAGLAALTLTLLVSGGLVARRVG
jgi:hypothetical protein